jgi:putative transposase
VPGVKEYAENLLGHLDTLTEDIEVLRVNVQIDHVHLVLVIPPRVSVASVIQFMKSQSAKILKEKFSFMQKAIYGRGGIWSRGYCVSTVGLDEKAILAYVEHQQHEDTGQLKLDLG